MHFQDYDIEAELYRSRTSHVYRVREKSSGKGAVIKALVGDHPSTNRIERFHREYEILQMLSARGAVAIITPMALLDGYRNRAMVLEDFGAVCLAKAGMAGTLDPKSLLTIALKLAGMLSPVHANGVIHCDINPSNILINRKTGQMKLIDFNISAQFDRINTSYRHPDTLEGTLAYISPEQTGRVNRSIDYRSDFYSLGVTLYELATGVRPFSGEDHLELVYGHIAVAAAPLTSHNPQLPGMFSDIVLKLMAKDAKDRYQSVTGLTADLSACIFAMENGAPAENIPLGEKDRSRFLQVPEQLYGRSGQIAQLLSSYQRTLAGKRVLVTVGGLPGTGKTALVRKLHLPVTRDRGIFISGKFDPLQRDRPYSAFNLALTRFAGQVLAGGPSLSDHWKEKLSGPLANIGQVLVDAVPSMEKIIGPQEPLSPLTGEASRNRTLLAWRTVFRKIAHRDHPLVLFLDDLQWADAGSLDLLKHLLADKNLSWFLPVCAFRSNEVTTGHPLMKIIDSGAPNHETNEIAVGNLDSKAIVTLLSDSLGDGEDLPALAELIHEKTMGNPFFTLRFFLNLHRENLLYFHEAHASWRWDKDALNDHGLTDNVAELLSENLVKLPSPVRQTLEYASCIGNHFTMELLAAVTGKEAGILKAELRRGIGEGLLSYRDNAFYGFTHDRVRQAAYGRMDEKTRASVHHRAGRYLLAHLSPRRKEQRRFEIVDHLFSSVLLITDPKERLELAQLSEIAGRQAQASGVFTKAFDCFEQGIDLFSETIWEMDYPLALRLYTGAAQTANLSGRYRRMDHYAQVVHERAVCAMDRVKVFEAVIQAKNAQADNTGAVETALEILALLDVRFPQREDKAQFSEAFGETMALVERMDEIALLAANPCNSPTHRAVMGIINMVSDAAFHARPDLLPHLVFRQVRITLTQGISPESTVAFALFGLILCGPVEEIETGVRFGDLAIRILDRLDARAFRAKTLLVVNNCIRHWKTQNRGGLAHFQDAYHAGLETGDLSFAALSAHAYCYNALFTAMGLCRLEKEMRVYDERIEATGHLGALGLHRCYYQVTRNLAGKAEAPHRLAGEFFDGDARLPELLAAGNRTGAFVVYFCRIFLGTYLGKPGVVEENLPGAKACQDGAVALIHNPMLNFYESLFLLDRYREVSADEREEIRERVGVNQRVQERWATHAPVNHAYKHLLVAAREQQLWGEAKSAGELYAGALSSVLENGYRHEEILIRERLAGFYFETGRFGQGIREIQYAYHAAQRWGAAAIACKLMEQYLQYIGPDDQPATSGFEGTVTTTSTNMAMDTRSIVRAFGALSAEIQLEKLLEKMMEIIIKSAGATRGFFLEFHGGKFLIQAAYSKNAVTDILSNEVLATTTGHPESVLNQVVSSEKPILLESLLANRQFSFDPAHLEGGDRSVLSVPVIHKGNLLAVIYLENDLSQGVFTQSSLELITILAGQVAISFENARLYNTLEQKVTERTSALAAANEELRHLASVDKLTGVANRRIFDELLHKEWQRLGREKGSLSVVLGDIDFFKNYNDTYGHQAGDECLAKVAAAIERCMRRPGDLVARYGGEEFGIILPHTNREGAVEIAQMVRKAVHALGIPNEGAAAGDCVTLSLGVATVIPETSLSPEELLSAADRSLYRAKAAGRNRVDGDNGKPEEPDSPEYIYTCSACNEDTIFATEKGEANRERWWVCEGCANTAMRYGGVLAEALADEQGHVLGKLAPPAD